MIFDLPFFRDSYLVPYEVKLPFGSTDEVLCEGR